MSTESVELLPAPRKRAAGGGRKAAPRAVQEARGTHVSRLRDSDPLGVVSVDSEPPAFLGEAGRRKWLEVAETQAVLARKGLAWIGPQEAAALAAYCMSWELYIGAVEAWRASKAALKAEARRRGEEDGLPEAVVEARVANVSGLLAITPDGRPEESPFLTVLYRAQAAFLKAAKDCQLLPAARAVIRVVESGGEQAPGGDDDDLVC